jgi:hypothetical protein
MLRAWRAGLPVNLRWMFRRVREQILNRRVRRGCAENAEKNLVLFFVGQGFDAGEFFAFEEF